MNTETKAAEAVGSSAELGLVARLRHWLSTRRNAAALRIQMEEELCQLGYTVRDGLLYPPENSDEWDALVTAMLRRRQEAVRRREKERLMGGIL